MVLTHGPTSEGLLRIDWDSPVYVPEPNQDVGTKAAARRALTADEALRVLAGDDRRPLLVLRECHGCRGTDMALLQAHLPNDRTLLLAGFFHCVRLPSDAMEDDHPFRAMFENHTHLFLCGKDGTGRVDFPGSQTQSALWKAMSEVLRRELEVDADDAVGDLHQILAQLDRVDAREGDLLRTLDAELAKKGPGSPRLPDLQDRLRALGEERDALLVRVAGLGRRAGV